MEKINGLSKEELIEKIDSQSVEKRITTFDGGGKILTDNDDTPYGEGVILAEKIKELFDEHAPRFNAQEIAIKLQDELFDDEGYRK